MISTAGRSCITGLRKISHLFMYIIHVKSVNLYCVQMIKVAVIITNSLSSSQKQVTVKPRIHFSQQSHQLHYAHYISRHRVRTDIHMRFSRTWKDQIQGFSRTQKSFFQDFSGNVPFKTLVAQGQKVHIQNRLSMYLH